MLDIKKNKMIILIASTLFLRKLVDHKLFLGIIVGFALAYAMNNNLFASINLTPEKKTNKDFFYINNDLKLKRAFMDIRRFETFNFIAVNKALECMERFLQIKDNFANLENTKQFYDLAYLERKKAMRNLRSLLLKIRVRYRKRVLKIIKYISRVSKKYLVELSQINNDRWNQDYTTSSMGPIYTDRLLRYNE